MAIEKLSIIIPDDVDKVKILEKIISFCERSGCDIKTNPHIEKKETIVLNEEQQVEQILGINPAPKPE